MMFIKKVVAYGGYLTIKAKEHFFFHVHLSVFQQWLLKLENRKNLVRVEIPTEQDGTPKDVFPKSITQQRPNASHYTLKNGIKDLVDVEHQLRGIFPAWTSITKDLDMDWTTLESMLKEADYRKDLNMVDTTKWKSHGPECELLAGWYN